MTATRPSFIALLIAAYWDLNRVLRELWRPALIACLVLAGVQIAGLVVPRLLSHSLFERTMLRQAIEVGGLILLAPFLIAIHRFVLLGETTRRYAIDLASPRFQLFAGWLVVVGMLASIPSLLIFATTPMAPIYYTGRPPSPDLAQVLMLLAVLIAVFVVVARMAILFPAVAVDAPGAIWQNAIADTRGHTWYVVLAPLIPAIPLLLLFAAAIFLVRLTMPRPLPGLTMELALRLGMYIVPLAQAAVVAARLYQVLGDRLNRTPQ